MTEDVEGIVAACVMFAPEFKPKPLFEITFTFSLDDVDPEVFDLLCCGQSPPPHIVLGEN